MCTATLLLDGEDWSVGLDMITPYLNDMVGFFEEIADARAGWSDKKWWESEFDELTIWRATRATVSSTLVSSSAGLLATRTSSGGRLWRARMSYHV